MPTTREWDGQTLTLRPDEAELFDKALAKFNDGGGMDVLMQFVLNRKSVIWKGDDGAQRRGSDVIKLPLWHAIKLMARRSGVKAGLLIEAPGTHPKLEDFLREAK